jgi:DNA repair exonuclease SbcCD ATPase subunit
MDARPPARRFLAPQARSGNGLGYLSQPAREFPIAADPPEVVERVAAQTDWRDEPEGLDRLDYELHIDERAIQHAEQQRKFETAQREQARRLMDFEQRLVTAHKEAQRRCIDVASEVRLLRHMQSAGKQVRHLEQRLGVIERKVWRDAA